MFLLVFLLESCFAQEAKQEKSGADFLVVKSNPVGAIVELKGLYKFTGKTPFLLPAKVEGEYEVKAKMRGYESVTKQMNFVDATQQEINLRLRKRTPLKAALRSVALPGWGQAYGGNRFRAAVVGAVQIGLGVFALAKQNEFRDAEDDVARALEVFNQTLSDQTFLEYQNTLKVANDAYDWRNRALMIVGGFWLYNVLDSILFFSDKPTARLSKSSISKRINNNELSLSLTISL